jgi:hypothetical protein
MKHLLILLLVICTVTVMAQDKKEVKAKDNNKLLSNAEELSPMWDDYVKSVNNDSTLQIYWIYSGKEKPEYKTDSTVVKGAASKVIIIQPTMKQEWIKGNPTFNGFKEWIKNKSL